MTDEPRVEIEPCPMPGCVDCDYRFGRSLPTRSDAIAAHNALCADVQRGRDATKIEQTARDLRHENEALLDMIDKAEAERDALRAEVERLRGSVSDQARAVPARQSQHRLSRG